MRSDSKQELSPAAQLQQKTNQGPSWGLSLCHPLPYTVPISSPPCTTTHVLALRLLWQCCR